MKRTNNQKDKQIDHHQLPYFIAYHLSPVICHMSSIIFHLSSIIIIIIIWCFIFCRLVLLFLITFLHSSHLFCGEPKPWSWDLHLVVIAVTWGVRPVRLRLFRRFCSSDNQNSDSCRSPYTAQDRWAVRSWRSRTVPETGSLMAVALDLLCTQAHRNIQSTQDYSCAHSHLK